MPLVETGDDLPQHTPRLASVLLFRECLNRLHEREASVEQGQQFLTEQCQWEMRAAPRAPSRPASFWLDRQNGVALRLGLTDGIVLVGRIERQRYHAISIA